MPAKFIKAGHRPDYFLLALIFLLTVGGLVILASASSDLGKIKFNDSYYYLKHQMLYGLSFGILGFLAGAIINYQRYRKLTFLLLLINIALLTLVFTRFGVTAGGASRWLHLGPISFQPAELLKLTFIAYLAAWLANPRMNRAGDFEGGALPFFIVSALIAGLLFLQPATSIVVILLGAGLLVYFLSGVPWKHLLLVCALGLLGLGLIVWSTPYRLERVLNFLNPSRDTQGSGYQITQALITIGSGGLWGVGCGQSTTKINLLPAPIDDSIFAIAAQELGFAGAGGLALLFGILVFRLLWIAKSVRDRFGQLMIVGFASIIALQSLVNMAAISGLIPLTGVPLPFVSYGGTALAVFLTMSGIAVNVSKYS